MLVAYGTWAGSTAEVAAAVAEELRGASAQVDVRPAGEVEDLATYSGVVIGTAVHAGRLHRDVPAFVRRHAARLRELPVAYFVVCLTMKENTEETRSKAEGFLARLRKAHPDVRPVAVGLFGGAIRTDDEYLRRLSLPERLMVKAMKLKPVDHRDWTAIRQWANELVPRLSGGPRRAGT